MANEQEAIVHRDGMDPRVRIAEALERIADDFHKIATASIKTRNCEKLDRYDTAKA